MAGNKSSEGKLCVDEVFVVNEIGEINESNGLDIANTLKGLKAIQREARKATSALKEYDDAVKRKCPKCNTLSLEIITITANEVYYQTHRKCTHCNYKDVINND